MSSLLSDSRYALRQLRRNPGSTAAAVLTLALSIGVTTAIFSVVYGVLLRPLPYSRPDRIMAIFEITNKGRLARLADPNFNDFRDQSRSFQAVAKYSSSVVSVSGASQPTRTTIVYVSPDFLKVFDIQPVLGRDFTGDDSRRGASPTVVVSHKYWSEHLGSTADLAPARLKIGNEMYQVIGVLPAGFQFPAEADLWAPAGLQGENTHRTSHNFSGVGRLKDGFTPQQANQDISAIGRRIHAASSEQNDYLLKDATAIPLQESMTGKVKSTLLLLFGAVGFLLLVGCANVANLMLAQVASRGRELAIRSALGAGLGHLMAQFLTEAFLLAIGSGALGVLGAYEGTRAILAVAPASLPRMDAVSISLPVLAFALLLSFLVAVGLGVFAAFRANVRDPREGLLEGGRGQAGSQSSRRLGSAIVAAQVAITMVLIVGAGLFGRSLIKVLEVNPGFRVEKILTMDVSLPSSGNPKAKQIRSAFYATLIDRLKQIPGVQKVGATAGLPLDGGHADGMFLIMSPSEMPDSMDALAKQLGAVSKQKERIGNADFCPVTGDYFQVLGIPLVRGRVFDERDGADAPHVAVITESLARERWPNQDPLGRTIQFGNMDGDLHLLTIVGIVADTREYGLELPPTPTMYVNAIQRPRAAMSIAMLTGADTASVAGAARGVLRELNPEVPPRFRLLSDLYAASLGSRRFNLILIATFAGTALLLATIGVFGVMAYSVSRRTREIGVRVALGASAGIVLRMVLGQGMRTIGIGVVIGIAGSLALTRTIASMLFGVTATDPATFAGVTLLLIATALLACYIPARRATEVDPMVALRQE